jgi:formate-dependent nitrite reductase membrane component NrfD
VSESGVTRKGLRGVRPGREATPGTDVTPGTEAGGRRRRRAGRRDGTGRRAEQPMVPPAEFASYYGMPILNAPVWRSPDIPGYLFLGGLAGGSSLLAAGAQLTGRPGLARASKAGAAGAIGLGLAGLVNDLGRPARLVNMLRVFKVTSPMSVGSWILSGYAPAAGAAAACALTGRLPRAGAAATAGAAVLAPGLASYTAALITDTAVPAWHDGHREMPFVFAGSAAMAAGGFGLLAAPPGESQPARNLALLGVVTEAAAFERMTRRMGLAAETYRSGRAGAYIRAGQVLSVLGVAGALLGRGGRRGRAISALSGASLLAASAATRWGIFHAGLASAADPKYTVVPQRERREARQRERAGAPGPEPAGTAGPGNSGTRGQERAGPGGGVIA